MKKYLFLFLVAMQPWAVSLWGQTQNDYLLQNRFWFGSGPDSSAVVISFNNGANDSSYIWGVLHDGPVDITALLQSLVLSDENLSITATQTDVLAVSYLTHNAIAQEPESHWELYQFEGGQWTSVATLEQTLPPGSLIGLSFTDSLDVLPGLPRPAYDPHAVQIQEWEDSQYNWFGEGNAQALLFVDFIPNQPEASYVFGVRFDDSATGLDLLQMVAQQDTQFSFNGEAFLTDVFFREHEGLGGNPHFWGTWSATNFGNWRMNSGLSQKVFDGDFIACTYTDFSPALRPGLPQRIQAPDDDNISVSSPQLIAPFSVFPNPARHEFTCSLPCNAVLEVFNSVGKRVYTSQQATQQELISIASWPQGVYIVCATTAEGQTFVNRLIKH